MDVILLPLLGIALAGGEAAESDFLVHPSNHMVQAELQLRLESPILLRTPECQDRVRLAQIDLFGRELEREPASPEKPIAMYAVDRRENGCGVMVMMGDLDDVRPLPVIPQDRDLLMRIPANETTER